MRRNSGTSVSHSIGGGVRAGGSNNKLMVEKIYLAKPRGFCAGVVMAIKAVEQAAQEMKASNQGEDGSLPLYRPQRRRGAPPPAGVATNNLVRPLDSYT